MNYYIYMIRIFIFSGVCFFYIIGTTSSINGLHEKSRYESIQFSGLSASKEDHALYFQPLSDLALILKNNLVWSQAPSLLYTAGVLGIGGFVAPALIPMTSALLAFTFYFFRNPDRTCPEALNDQSVIVCPCDGRVIDIQYDPNGIQGTSYTRKISIFLSPLDVHVNWIPMTGIIHQIRYFKGAFKAAFLPKSSLLNEHNDIEIYAEHAGIQRKILVRQIAGAIARRICCWIKEEEAVLVGQKYGMIRFGSRVDIFLPEAVNVSVSLQERVEGGHTILARWN